MEGKKIKLNINKVKTMIATKQKTTKYMLKERQKLRLQQKRNPTKSYRRKKSSYTNTIIPM